MTKSPYEMAQEAMAKLRIAIHLTLESAPPEGLTNAEIGRSLGIYMGHKGHQGHISRTILAMMEQEGVVKQQSESRQWKLASAQPSKLKD